MLSNKYYVDQIANQTKYGRINRLNFTIKVFSEKKKKK